jgi:hypothetical protein
MTPLIAVLGIVGAILILVGLVGGDFTLSGKLMPQVAMPKIGNWVRLPCFSVGAILVVVAVSLAVTYSPPQFRVGTGSPQAPVVSATRMAATSSAPSPTDTSIEIAIGIVMAPQGFSALDVFEQPSLSSPVVAEIAGGADIDILCTVEGDVVTNPVNGQSSSLWDSTSEGYVPDVYVSTGTNQPTMGSC